VLASAAPLRALLVNLARLSGANARSADALMHFLHERFTPVAEGLRPVVMAGTKKATMRGPDVTDVFPPYLQAVEHLARLVDEWTL
jgi:hypothetical protein